MYRKFIFFILLLILPLTSSEITVDLQVSQTSGVAPLGVYFDATGTTEPGVLEPFRQLQYSWDFGDSGSTFENRPGIDANKMDGPAIAAHVYENPGTYTVTLTITNPATKTSTTHKETITVFDTDDWFSKNGRTYCVSNQNDFTGCPTTDPNFHISPQKYNVNRDLTVRDVMFCFVATCPGCNPDIVEVDGTVSNRGRCTISGMETMTTPSTPARVLFKRGESFKVVDSRSVKYVASYGEGKNVEFLGGGLAFNGVDGPTVTGIDFKGDYDPETCIGNSEALITGGSGTALGIGASHTEGTKKATIYKNTFTGYGLTVDVREAAWTPSGIKPYPENLVFADNKITNWQDYGFAFDLYHGAIIGNIIRQSESATQGDEGKAWFSLGRECADHGPIRLSRADYALIAYNDFYSHNGWSSSGFGIQPILRFTADSDTAVVYGNRMEGGLIVAANVPANGDSPGVVTNVLWEKNFMIAGENSDAFLESAAGGQIIRNNIFYHTPIARRWPGFGTSGLAEIIRIGGIKYLEKTDLPNYIYNNHVISFTDEISPTFLKVDEQDSEKKASTEFYVHNNLLHLPKAGTFIRYNNENPAEITSDYNLIYSTIVSWYDGQDANSLTSNPEFVNVPDFCSSTKRSTKILSGVEISGDGTYGYLTKTGADFENLQVLHNARINIRSSVVSVSNFDCDYNDLADSNLGSCNWKVVLRVSGDVITLAHDIMMKDKTDLVEIEFPYSPSTNTKVYVEDNTNYNNGDKITYKDHTTPYTISSKGKDLEGDFVVLNVALPEKANGYICKWPSSTSSYVLDFSLKETSPARGSGKDNIDIGAFGAGIVSFPICGDGNKEGTEQCDDGNLVSSDGCSNVCETDDKILESTTSLEEKPRNSGGGGAAPDKEKINEAQKDKTIHKNLEDKRFLKGETYDFEINNPFIKNINLKMRLDVQEGNFKVIEKDTSNNKNNDGPSSQSSENLRGKTYRTFEINPTEGLEKEEAIQEGVITFVVEKSWILENNIDKENGVILLRLHEYEWENYPGKFIKDSDSELVYESIIPGFSEFKIIGLTTKELLEKERKEKIVSASALIISLIIVGALGLILLTLMHVKKVKREREFKRQNKIRDQKVQEYQKNLNI